MRFASSVMRVLLAGGPRTTLLLPSACETKEAQLREHEALTGDERRPCQVVPPLELPDAFARVAAVVRRGDRPERVGRLHYVVLRLSRAAGRSRVRADDEGDGREQDDESRE